jgi:hypothetical protein
MASFLGVEHTSKPPPGPQPARVSPGAYKAAMRHAKQKKSSGTTDTNSTNNQNTYDGTRERLITATNMHNNNNNLHLSNNSTPNPTENVHPNTSIKKGADSQKNHFDTICTSNSTSTTATTTTEFMKNNTTSTTTTTTTTTTTAVEEKEGEKEGKKEEQEEDVPIPLIFSLSEPVDVAHPSVSAQNPALVQSLESQATEWMQTIDLVSKRVRSAPAVHQSCSVKDLPLAELNFWKLRTSQLEPLSKQAETEFMKNVTKVLMLANSENGTLLRQ